jgi:hypothetical protein
MTPHHVPCVVLLGSLKINDCASFDSFDRYAILSSRRKGTNWVDSVNVNGSICPGSGKAELESGQSNAGNSGYFQIKELRIVSGTEACRDPLGTHDYTAAATIGRLPARQRMNMNQEDSNINIRISICFRRR